jgi:hypothetical protein
MRVAGTVPGTDASRLKSSRKFSIRVAQVGGWDALCSDGSGRADFEGSWRRSSRMCAVLWSPGSGRWSGVRPRRTRWRWAWQNWERVQEIESPVGYLYSTVECRLPRRAGAGEATLIERLVENRGTR